MIANLDHQFVALDKELQLAYLELERLRDLAGDLLNLIEDTHRPTFLLVQEFIHNNGGC